MISSPLPLLPANNETMKDLSHPPQTVHPCPKTTQMDVIPVSLAEINPDKPYNPMTPFPTMEKYTQQQQSLSRMFRASGIAQGTQRETSS
jgi:hypothetical protein